MATQKQVFTEAHENIDKANHTTSGLIDYLRYIFGKLENASGGGGGGSEVSYTQTLASGTETGTIEIDGVSTKMYAPTPAAPTEVEVTQVISTGTKIATISVDDVPIDIFAPNGGGSGWDYTVVATSTSNTTYASQIAEIKAAFDLLTDDQKRHSAIIYYNNIMIMQDMRGSYASTLLDSGKVSTRVISLSTTKINLVEINTNGSVTNTDISASTNTDKLTLVTY